ncbi:Voltage-dependent calcium channel gamma-7 subunit [Bulinus truncatus]|nr:Voltage-dependent calcium channel gamma-7 subunit [Bulinus truncatus]
MNVDAFLIDNEHNPAECSYIEYFTDEDREGLGPTDAILLNIRQATMFPLVSLLILLIGGIMCFIGHCNENRKILTFVSGILFVLAGLCTLVGIILYIGSITGEVGNKPRASVEEPRFIYDYGSSFFMAVGSFVLTELSGVFSVYLYISKHKHSQRVKRLAIKSEHNDKNHQTSSKTVRRVPRDKSRDRSLSCDRSRDPSTSRSESYFTYTPISETSHELSNYTFTRSHTNNTISTTAELHGAHKENSCGAPAPCAVRTESQPSVIPCIDIVRRTTPV